ncbi:SGNH/GDSL hydrolase family protein [Terrabacter sp. NPDC000476]|uniref:SGNH/GDSL hydrolase family protein n=1 Tax=Terrabacter sp. NPDC000476 TaxID=3154258 RepID=UPI0033277A03
MAEPRGRRGRMPSTFLPRHLDVVLGVVVLVVVVGGALMLGGVVPNPLAASSSQHREGPTAATGSTGATRSARQTPSPSAATTTPPGTSTTTSAVPPGPMTLVGLGDSVPSAETCGCTGYLEQVGAQLGRATGRRWVVHNDANGGATTADVEQDVTSGPTRDHLADADLVVIEVGANDFDLAHVGDPDCLPAATSDCWTETLTAMGHGLRRIITDVRAIDPRPDLRIAVIGYWNVTVDGAVGRALGTDFVLGSDELTRLVNDTVAQVATSTHALYVDAYAPLKGTSGTRDPTGDLLDDGDHPNASGHTLLGTAVIDALQRDGAVERWKSG